MDAGFFSVEVEVDRTREVRIDFNVICEVEKITGISMLQDWTQVLSAQGLRAICYVNWKRTDPELTLEQCGMIVGQYVHVISDKITEAIVRSMPEPQEGAEGEDPTVTTTATH